MELLVGCGNDKTKRMQVAEFPAEWTQLVTLDIDEKCYPDVRWDLDDLPYPFRNNTFDEIHAYEVLEHCGRQGDWRFFFDQFTEFWRILKPNGVIAATVPSISSVWAWGDPGHTRVIPIESLVYLSQSQYEKQIGNTCMTDYRSVYHVDFDCVWAEDKGDRAAFVLRKRGE